MALDTLIPEVTLSHKKLDRLSGHFINKLNQPTKKNNSFAGVICFCLGLLAIPFAAKVESLPMTKPYLNLNIDPPTSQAAPKVLPILRPSPTPLVITPQKPANPSVIQPLLLSQRQDPVARAVIVGEQVDVQLINRTGTVVSYEAIQETDYAELSPGKKTILQDLRTPITIMLDRNDRGNLRVTTRSLQGLLEVYLDSTANFNHDTGVVRIEESGAVYLD